VTVIAETRPAVSADQGAQGLLREARLRRRRRRLFATAALTATAGLVIGLIASLGGAPPKRPHIGAGVGDTQAPKPAVGHFTLRGNGIGGAHFGQSEFSAIIALDKVLGIPTSRVPTNDAPNCGIDAYMQWSAITAYFGQQRFIGFSTTWVNGIPRSPIEHNAATSAGLEIGDSLAQARQIYGTALTTSFAQGGAWFATTPTGRLAGNLTDEVNESTPPPRIEDITAGTVGCPAASP
jgi:hypothetical protein